MLFVIVPTLATAQSQPDLTDVVKRLERLELQNHELLNEVRALREQLSARGTVPAPPLAATDPTAATPPQPELAQAPLDERVNVIERRQEELEQSKVGAEHKLPVRLTGTVLFNAYANGRYGTSDNQYPTTANQTAGPVTGGGTFRQTIIGLKFDGPGLPAGGQVGGAVYLDLFGGTGTSLNTLMRLRIASLDLKWRDTTVSIAQDKPLIAPREPESLAQLGFSPLTGAGNLWLWQPQLRVEQRLHFGENAGLKAQAGVYQTSETGTGLGTEYRDIMSRSRAGYEGRFEFWKSSGDRRVEIAPGVHVSDSHIGTTTVPSRILTVDWLIRPTASFDWTGAFFSGKNVGVLGGLRQGITSFPSGELRAIEAMGGWTQLTWRTTQRLTFTTYAGQEDDRNSDLLRGNIGKNLVYAGNVFYRLGPNVIASFEASQTRTTYFGIGTRLNTHYDLALAYLF